MVIDAFAEALDDGDDCQIENDNAEDDEWPSHKNYSIKKYFINMFLKEKN